MAVVGWPGSTGHYVGSDQVVPYCALLVVALGELDKVTPIILVPTAIWVPATSYRDLQLNSFCLRPSVPLRSTVHCHPQRPWWEYYLSRNPIKQRSATFHISASIFIYALHSNQAATELYFSIVQERVPFMIFHSWKMFESLALPLMLKYKNNDNTFHKTKIVI